MTQWILTSCAMILAVLGLRFLLKGRISLRLQYALWLLVAVRLLVPLTFGESRLSAANLSRNTQPVVEQIQSLEIPVQSFDSAYEEVLRERLQQGEDVTGFENSEDLEYEAYQRMEKLPLSRILMGVWIAGMALSFAVLVLSNLHFYWKLRRDRRPVPLPDCKLPVYCAPQIVTPCLFGLLRPAIYITGDVLEDHRALAHVLAHEQTHHHHGDHLWSLLRGICLCIHWYNPLVWIAAHVSRRDAELACDEAAIRRLGEENRLDYGRTLIGLTCEKGTSPLLTATTMTGSKQSIKERITLIAKKPKFSVVALIVLILAVTIAAGCSFSGPEASGGSTPDYSLFAFPGTEWGMTPEQVMEALEITEDDVALQTDTEGHIRVMEAELDNVFGTPGTVTFSFLQIDEEIDYEFLSEVYVYYPDETDMDAVRSKMARVYGAPTLYDAPPKYNLGTLESSEGHVSRWDSEATLGEYMSDTYADFRVRTSVTGPNEYILSKANALKEELAAVIWWTDDGRWMTYRTIESETPGKKGLIFSASELAYLRTIENVDFLREIPMDESLLTDYLYTIRRDAICCIVRQEQDAGIAIADAYISIKEVTTQAQPISSVYESVIYEVSWQVRPETADGILIGKEEAFIDGQIVPTESIYYMVEHREGITGYIDGIPYSEDTTIIATRSASALEAEYGTPELIEQYGDMFTAFAMENARDVKLEIKP